MFEFKDRKWNYLYRGKRLGNKEWCVGNLVLSDDADEDYRAIIIPMVGSRMFSNGNADESCHIGFEKWYQVDNATICRCTGKTDKIGKLIWENDIVRADNGNLYRAFWQDKYKQFSWQCVKSDMLPRNLWSIRGCEIEIVGNIFDNPELITQ